MSQTKIRASFIRGGTSKGVFFQEKDLPRDLNSRNNIFMRVLGSPDLNGRQLNGLGGGTSSLSKIMVVKPSVKKGVDIDYTFGQVAVDKPLVSYEGNCGNLTSAVGPFAIDEELLKVSDGTVSLRLLNTNTDKLVVAHFNVIKGKTVVDGTETMAGVSGKGHPINLEFISPSGSVTKNILPSGKEIDFIEVDGIGSIPVSLVDASTACVFVSASSLKIDEFAEFSLLTEQKSFMALLEKIRQLGAINMGLSGNTLSIPKLVILGGACEYSKLDGNRVKKMEVDLTARAISMGTPHKAIPLTAAMCLSAAARIPGTIANQLSSIQPKVSNVIRVGHPSGVFSSKTTFVNDTLRSISVTRTQRRLMDGYVYY